MSMPINTNTIKDYSLLLLGRLLRIGCGRIRLLLPRQTTRLLLLELLLSLLDLLRSEVILPIRFLSYINRLLLPLLLLLLRFLRQPTVITSSPMHTTSAFWQDCPSSPLSLLPPPCSCPSHNDALYHSKPLHKRTDAYGTASSDAQWHSACC